MLTNPSSFSPRDQACPINVKMVASSPPVLTSPSGQQSIASSGFSSAASSMLTDPEYLPEDFEVLFQRQLNMILQIQKESLTEKDKGEVYTDKRVSFLDLNDDVLLQIFEYLDFKERFLYMRVCQRWRSVLGYLLQKQTTLCLGSFRYFDGSTVDPDFNASFRYACEDPKSHLRPSQPVGYITPWETTMFKLPACAVTKCFELTDYNQLHLILTKCPNIKTIVLLRVQMDARLLVSLGYNCPELEHLELISCHGGEQVKIGAMHASEDSEGVEVREFPRHLRGEFAKEATTLG